MADKQLIHDRRDLWRWAGAGAIVLLTLLAYLPAINGRFIWDDDSYIIDNTLLHNLDGLRRIWIPLQTPQYYPAVFSMFWGEYQIWGLQPLGYHLVNVLLHIANALLVWRLCAVLKIPGGWMIGAVFALHPVHVESVAWITERKNLLSGFFYLLAALCYLRFDDDHPPAEPGANGAQRLGWYSMALGLFVLALLSKTVTCSLPAALILMMMWQRKPMTPARLRPLLPLFVLGLALALHTAGIERAHVGAEGGEFAFTFMQRVLIACNALLFYLSKLLWPWPVMFVYPRWAIDSPSLAMQLAPLAVAAIALTAVIASMLKVRGPLLALLFFAGTLVPALGFVNIYPMRFSFVADHFQYLASLGVIALVVGSFVRLVKMPAARAGAAIVILPILAALTWRQAGTYHDAESVYRDTLSKNDQAWMPHNNLGNILIQRDPVEAEEHYRKALHIKPDHYTARINLAEALRLQHRLEEAVTECEAAIRIIRVQINNPSARLPEFLAPDYHKLGQMQEQLGHAAEAEAAYRQALAIAPQAQPSRLALANLLMKQDRLDEAAAVLSAAIERNSKDWAARRGLAIIRAKQQQHTQAIALYEQALAAAVSFTDRLQILPALIRLLATCPDPNVRDVPRAIALAEDLCAKTSWAEPASLDMLASVYADAGRVSDAIQTAEKALDLAQRAGLDDLARDIQKRLDGYRANASRSGK